MIQNQRYSWDPSYFLVFILFFMIVLVSGCVTEEHPEIPTSVKIGVLSPLSGESSGSGKDCLNGMLLAIEEINTSGGIMSLNGINLTLVVGDTQGVPSVGEAETKRLIQDEDVVAVIGAYHSSVTIASTEVAEKLKTPYIVNVGIADAITERGFKYLFRIIPKAEYYGRNEVQFLNDLPNLTGTSVKRVALLHENTGFGTAAALGQREALIKAGYEPVVEIGYDAGNVTNMTDEIARILAADPDIILETTYLEDSILIRQELARVGSRIPVLDTAGGTVTARYIADLGLLAEDTMTISEYSTRVPEGKQLNERFYERFGTNITGDSMYSYQAVWVLKDALERAGSVNRQNIRDALSDTDIPAGDHMILPDERIRFDSTGQNEYSQLFILQIQHGELVPIWPEKYAIAPVHL